MKYIVGTFLFAILILSIAVLIGGITSMSPALALGILFTALAMALAK
jgi:hypothetical protein